MRECKTRPGHVCLGHFQANTFDHSCDHRCAREHSDETPADVINEQMRLRVSTLPVAGSKPLQLVPKRVQGKQQLLEIVDDLRAKVESGEIIALSAVGIEPDDCTRYWQGSVEGVTWLRMIGAIACLMDGAHREKDGG